MQVDFIIVGAQKSGTTSIAQLVSQHPSICFCKEKEPSFFNRDYWKTNIKEYHALYESKVGQKLGEASTMYTFFPEYPKTAKNIYDYNPKMKLIYIMRDPIERIVSHFAHRYVRKKTKEDPYSEILSKPMYVNRSRYFIQIEPYLKRFGNDQVLLLVMEDFVREPNLVLNKIFTFLEVENTTVTGKINESHKNSSVESTFLTDSGKKLLQNPLLKKMPYKVRNVLKSMFVNSLKEKPEISEDLRRLLYPLVKSDIKNIEELLKREITEWKKY